MRSEGQFRLEHCLALQTRPCQHTHTVKGGVVNETNGDSLLLTTPEAVRADKPCLTKR